MATGIRKRHGRGCSSTDERCKCPWEAFVYSKRDGRKIRKTFPTFAAARGWRNDASSSVRKGALRAPTSVTLEQAWTVWEEGARAGLIRTRSGDEYKPGAIRGYEQALRLRVLPDLGHRKLAEITRVDLQDLVDALVAADWSPSTVVVAITPLRAIYKRACNRGDVAINPTTGLQLPAVRGGRDRIASPTEAAALLAALPDEQRTVWATALYAGLRRGELQALRWSDIDLKAGVIRVERSWDWKEGIVGPKSSKGDRKVPIARVLREHLAAHRLRTVGDGFVFGRTPNTPFAPGTVTDRAVAAWTAANEKTAERTKDEGRDVEAAELLHRITLHECRHTFASLMIAAGVNAKALSTYMGHANIAITLDRYGHLMPGNEDQAAALLDSYLDEALTQEGAVSVG